MTAQVGSTKCTTVSCASIIVNLSSAGMKVDNLSTSPLGRGRKEYIMNQIRRKKLADIKERIERISEELQEILNEEEEAKDNIPESFWETDRYATSEAACENMEYAVENLNDFVDNIDEVLDE